MLKAVFFDLDGTLLPLKEMKFARLYFKTLYKKVSFLGIKKLSLYKALYKGALGVINNNGEQTNEKLFWDIVTNYLGKDILNHMDLLNDYYLNEYKKCLKASKKRPESKKIVEFCKVLGLKTVLSTNPVFPKAAVINRMDYVLLNENDFDYITTYDNSRFCKPNPNYFKEILNDLNLKPEEVIVIGNNEVEDGLCAKKAGITSYLIDGKYLITKNKKKDIEIPIIKLHDVIKTIKNEYDLRKENH